jgi:hypothetical protein
LPLSGIKAGRSCKDVQLERCDALRTLARPSLTISAKGVQKTVNAVGVEMIELPTKKRASPEGVFWYGRVERFALTRRGDYRVSTLEHNSGVSGLDIKSYSYHNYSSSAYL